MGDSRLTGGGLRATLSVAESPKAAIFNNQHSVAAGRALKGATGEAGARPALSRNCNAGRS
jgi:hypothetical protein